MENMTDEQKDQLQDMLKEEEDWNPIYFLPWNS
jgi:hypothetical protein